MPTPVPIAYVWLDGSGCAWIGESGYKVSMLAEQHATWGRNAEALHEARPDLSLAQIHAALAYYHDHRAFFELEFQQGYARAAEFGSDTGESDLQTRLANLKRGQ